MVVVIQTQPDFLQEVLAHNLLSQEIQEHSVLEIQEAQDIRPLLRRFAA